MESYTSSSNLRLLGTHSLVKSRLSSSQLPFEANVDEIEMGRYLFEKGERSLLRGDLSGLHYFQQALQMDPNNANLHYRQGLSLFEFGVEQKDKKSLLLAAKSLKKATLINGSLFQAHQALGSVLYSLGTCTQEHHYFIESKNRYKQAIHLSNGQPSDVLADLYWEYGDVWARLGALSGELTDLQLAVRSYEQAMQHQEDLPHPFWSGYGNTLLHVALHTNSEPIYVRALECLRTSVSLYSSHQTWFELADGLRHLYEQTHNEDTFFQSDECFRRALQIDPQQHSAWLSWGCLLKESGQHLSDPNRLSAALEKCQKADNLRPDDPRVIATWSQALSLLGLHKESLELIHQGQLKAQSLLQTVHPYSLALYHALGFSTKALGDYFNDLDYYYQAIEYFQEGLSIDRTYPNLWASLGNVYMIIASIEDNGAHYEKAVRFFHKALHLKVTPKHHFYLANSLLRLGDMQRNVDKVRRAIYHFEKGLELQNNTLYLYPKWVFQYAVALDIYGDFAEEKAIYQKAIEMLSHLLMLEPNFPQIHHQIALTYGHFGELTEEIAYFTRSLHHFRLAYQRERENDGVLLDWGLTLINTANSSDSEKMALYREAEHKIVQSAKLGNVYAYYHLACLYALQKQTDKAMRYLHKAKGFHALPPTKDLLRDEWLENLYTTQEFTAFVSSLETPLENNKNR